MLTEAILDEISAREGWTDATKLFLTLQYIEVTGGDADAWRDYLEECAAEGTNTISDKEETP